MNVFWGTETTVDESKKRINRILFSRKNRKKMEKSNHTNGKISRRAKGKHAAVKQVEIK